MLARPGSASFTQPSTILPFAVVDRHSTGHVVGIVLGRLRTAPIPRLAENIGLIWLHVLNRRRHRVAVDVVRVLDRQHGVDRDPAGDIAGLRETVPQRLAAVGVHDCDPVLIVLALGVERRQFGVHPQAIVPIFGIDRVGETDGVIRGRRRPLHFGGGVLLFRRVQDARAGIVGAINHDGIVPGRQKLQNQRTVVGGNRVGIDAGDLDAVFLAPFLQPVAAIVGAGEFRNRTDAESWLRACGAHSRRRRCRFAAGRH